MPRPAWVEYLGQEAADELLPDSNIELQNLLANNPEFNITTIAVVLSKKAKELGLIDSYDDLKNLDMESWQKIISAYNGDGPKSIKYGEKVMEYLPYIKTILENASKNSW